MKKELEILPSERKNSKSFAINILLNLLLGGTDMKEERVASPLWILEAVQARPYLNC